MNLDELQQRLTEGHIVAPETAHAVKAVHDEALACKESGESKVILFNASGHGHFDLAAYDAFFRRELPDYELEQERIDQALTEIALAEDAWAMGDAAKALEHYRKAWEETIKATRTLDAEDFAPLAVFGRDFAIGQDWTGTESIDFWFKGTGSG